MKTLVKIIALTLAALTLASCATTPVYTYQSIDPVTREMGSSNIIKSTDTMDVAVYAFDVEDDSKDDGFMFVFQNKTSQPLDLSQTRINLYEGNAFENNWSYTSTWNPNSYLERARADVAFNNAFALIDFGIVLLDDDSDKFDAYLAASYAAGTVVEGTKTIEDIRNSSLNYNQMIPANSAVSGMAWFDINDKKPDIKLEIGNLNFIYGKSDREQIINPWLDRTRDRWTITGFVSVDSRHRFGFNTFYNTQSLGFYAGFSAQNIFKDHAADYEFEKGAFKKDNGVYQINTSLMSWLYDETVGGTFGLSYKIQPYTWLCAGIDMGTVKSYYKGTVQYRPLNSPDTPWTQEANKTAFGDFNQMYLRPQLGVSVIVNSLNIMAFASYDLQCDTALKGRRYALCLDLGLGYAF